MLANKNSYLNMIIAKPIYLNLVKQNLHKWDCYSSNEITKKEPKSEVRVSKFDSHDLSPIFVANASS